MLKFLVLINFEQIPEALQAGFSNVIEVAQHPVVALSWWEMTWSLPPSFPRNPGNNLDLFEWKKVKNRTVYLQFLGQFQLWRSIWLMISVNIFMAI